MHVKQGYLGMSVCSDNPVTRVSDMVWRRLNLILTTKHALRLSCALVHIYSCGNRNALGYTGNLQVTPKLPFQVELIRVALCFVNSMYIPGNSVDHLTFWSKVNPFHKFPQIGEKLNLFWECFQRPQDWGFKYNFPSESICQINLVSGGRI